MEKPLSFKKFLRLLPQTVIPFFETGQRLLTKMNT